VDAGGDPFGCRAVSVSPDEVEAGVGVLNGVEGGADLDVGAAHAAAFRAGELDYAVHMWLRVEDANGRGVRRLVDHKRVLLSIHGFVMVRCSILWYLGRGLRRQDLVGGCVDF